MAKNDGFLDSLKQQKLPSHQCSFGPIFVFSLTFFLGILCIGIGISLTKAASSIKEYPYDYSENETATTLNWTVPFTNFTGDVLIYYQLEGFYQLRLSMRHSFDYEHFAKADYSYICTGETEEQRRFRERLKEWAPNFLISFADLFLPRNRELNETAPVPCGQRANLFFNDTIRILDEQGLEVPFTNKGISNEYRPLFSSKLSKLFKNPERYDPTKPCDSFRNNFTKRTYDMPKYWKKPICELENAMENEDFIVWMTPSYAGTFRKPWKRLNRKYQWNINDDRKSTANYANGLPNGNYTIVIENNWSIPKISDPPQPLYRKKVIVSTVNWAGGKSNVLGYAYLIVGSVILLIGCGLALIQSFFPSYLRDEQLEKIRRRKSE